MFSGVGVSFPSNEKHCSHNLQKKTKKQNPTFLWTQHNQHIPNSKVSRSILSLLRITTTQCLGTLCCKKQSFKWYYYSVEAFIYPKQLKVCYRIIYISIDTEASIFMTEVLSVLLPFTLGSVQSASKLLVSKTFSVVVGVLWTNPWENLLQM